MKKGILFDLDGTLWDATKPVAESWNRVLERYHHRKRITHADMHALMGKTLDEISEIMIPELDSDARMEFMDACCREEVEQLRKVGGTLYPDLTAVLRLLQENYFLAIISNCGHGYIESFLDYHGLHPYFRDYEYAQRTGKCKGENIRTVMKRNGLTSAIYVGDTQGDRDAARLAKLPFVFAAYGFGKPDDHDASMTAISQLPDIAARLMDGYRDGYMGSK